MPTIWFYLMGPKELIDHNDLIFFDTNDNADAEIPLLML